MIIQNKQPLLFTTFSGVGGWEKGAKQAGFKSLYQCDNWEVAKAVHELNKGSNSIYPIDDYRTTEGFFDLTSIEKVNFKRIQEKVFQDSGVSLMEGDLDLYLSGSPCPDWSRVKPRRVSFTLRNKLMFDQYRIVGESKVKVAMLENVDGVLDIPVKDIYAELEHIWKLYRKDYHILPDILNSKDFESRQDRKRFIVIMVRKDLGVEASFPEPLPVNPKNYMHNVLPEVTHFYTKNGLVSTYNRFFRTMTASDSVQFMKNGVKVKATVEELLKLSCCEGCNLKAFVNGVLISYDDILTLHGNMVQVPFAYQLCHHVYKKILKY